MKRTVKGIVMELHRKSAVVMTPDGEFVKVNRPSSVTLIGEEIRSTAIENASPNFMKYGLIAAAIVLMLIPFTYFYQASATVAYVSVDINPSFELGINRYNKVTKVIPLNDEAEKMLKGLSLKGLNITQALNETIESAKDLGYVDEKKPNNIEIALVKLDKKSSSISEKSLAKYAEKGVTDADVEATITVQKADEETYNQAKKENMSTNQYLEKSGKEDKEAIKVDVKKSGHPANNKDKSKDKSTNGKGQNSSSNSNSTKNGTSPTPQKGQNNINGSTSGKTENEKNK